MLCLGQFLNRPRSLPWSSAPVRSCKAALRVQFPFASKQCHHVLKGKALRTSVWSEAAGYAGRHKQSLTKRMLQCTLTCTSAQACDTSSMAPGGTSHSPWAWLLHLNSRAPTGKSCCAHFWTAQCHQTIAHSPHTPSAPARHTNTSHGKRPLTPQGMEHAQDQVKFEVTLISCRQTRGMEDNGEKVLEMTVMY